MHTTVAEASARRFNLRMGFFDWFRRPRRLRTIFWVDEPSRLAGLVRAVQDDLARGLQVVVVAHFPAGLIEAGEALASAGVPFTTLARWQPLTPGPRVVALLAKALPTHDPATAAPPRANGPTQVSVRAAELHVLASENERVLHFADGSPVAAEACGYVSLDSPTMARMAGPRVKAMMATLGFKADQPIDNNMVTRGMVKALAKLERRVTGNLAADSLAQWMQKNLREG